MKKILPICITIFCINTFSSQAGVLIAQNLTALEDQAYALVDESGTLLSDTLTGNIKVGKFSITDSEITTYWSSGNLSAINSAFTSFGAPGNMYGGYPGVFQISASQSTTGFTGNNIYLFASTGSDFTNTSNQYLIYKFTQTYGLDSPLWTSFVLLGTDPGTLIIGGYNNFTADPIGAGPAPAYNTVAVIPEPSTFALLMLGSGTFLIMRKRRKLS